MRRTASTLLLPRQHAAGNLKFLFSNKCSDHLGLATSPCGVIYLIENDFQRHPQPLDFAPGLIKLADHDLQDVISVPVHPYAIEFRFFVHLTPPPPPARGGLISRG